MDTHEYFDRVGRGEPVAGGSEMHTIMRSLTYEAMQITAELNAGFHAPEEIRALFSRLTGRQVDETFHLYPPFYTNCGKNIHLGTNVFINFNCCFQDTGGIYIGDGTLIGSGVVIATLNHDPCPARRSTMLPASVVIGRHVWIGANATILPGVTIGDGAIIAAGAVVTRDVPENVLAAGVPATVKKRIEAD